MKNFLGPQQQMQPQQETSSSRKNTEEKVRKFREKSEQPCVTLVYVDQLAKHVGCVQTELLAEHFILLFVCLEGQREFRRLELRD